MVPSLFKVYDTVHCGLLEVQISSLYSSCQVHNYVQYTKYCVPFHHSVDIWLSIGSTTSTRRLCDLSSAGKFGRG